MLTQEVLMISIRSLWQEVRNQIPHISFQDNFFRKYFQYAQMTSLKIQSLISPLL